MRDNPFLKRSNPHRLYRSTENRVLLGVCAGLADYYGWSIAITRVITILLLFTPLVGAVILGYILLAVILPKRPQEVYRSPEEEQFWRAATEAPTYTVGQLRHRLRELEERLRGMESYVTSPRYDLDRELRKASRS